MPKSQKILVTGGRAPVALHLARLLGQMGGTVVIADSVPSKISATSTHCHDYILLPSPRHDFDAFVERLNAEIVSAEIEMIIPTCEEVFYLAMAGPRLAAPVLCPSIAVLGEMHNKFSFVEFLKRHDLPHPETALLQSKADIEAYAQDADKYVFKPAWSRFASHVAIRPSLRTFQAISPTPEAPWVAQEFVEGTEISIYALARGGKLMGLSPYQSIYKEGQGAGICLAPFAHDGITDFVQKFVALTQWDGQVSFDVILDTAGRVIPIECNPRATSGLQFFQDGAAFYAALKGTGAVEPDVKGLLCSHLAMLVFALPRAIGNGRLGRFITTYRRAADILDWDGDPLPRTKQLATLWDFAGIAFRKRCSLQAAATEDIEWNGPA